MESLQAQTIVANRMPNITWHKLKMNEATITLDELQRADQDAVNIQVPACAQTEEGGFDTALEALDAAQQWETGAGAQADAWLETAATQTCTVQIPAGVQCEEPLVIRVQATDNAASVAAVDVVVGEGASLNIFVHVDSPEPGNGVAATRIRIAAAANAQVGLQHIQTLDATWRHIDNVGIHLSDGASLKAAQTVLGAAESYTGFACNLAGYESKATVDTRYLGHGASHIDFNYCMRQRGANSTCTLVANGVLMDASSKVLRGTIDLIHGAKGAVGQENETVLLVSEDVRNKTIPIILCDEDDVQGAHGATIGHVNPEQLAYMRTRGLTDEQVEDLFAVASFDYAAAHAFDAQAAHAVGRLGQAVLGTVYDAFREDD